MAPRPLQSPVMGNSTQASRPSSSHASKKAPGVAPAPPHLQRASEVTLHATFSTAKTQGAWHTQAAVRLHQPHAGGLDMPCPVLISVACGMVAG